MALTPDSSTFAKGRPATKGSSRLNSAPRIPTESPSLPWAIINPILSFTGVQQRICSSPCGGAGLPESGEVLTPWKEEGEPAGAGLNQLEVRRGAVDLKICRARVHDRDRARRAGIGKLERPGPRRRGL